MPSQHAEIIDILYVHREQDDSSQLVTATKCVVHTLQQMLAAVSDIKTDVAEMKSKIGTSSTGQVSL